MSIGRRAWSSVAVGAAMLTLAGDACTRRAPSEPGASPFASVERYAVPAAPSEAPPVASTVVSAAPSPAASSSASVALPPPRPPPLERCAGAAAALPKPSARAACDPAHGPVERVSLVHVSDMHAHFHPYLGGRSPFALLRAHVDKRRADTGGRVLFLDGGDDLEKGSIADFASGGAATVHLLEYLGLDARTIGNHDFAYGLDLVLTQGRTQAYDLLASNLKYTPPPGADPTFGGKRWVVYEIGCARIGVFGLVINGYDETDQRYDEPYLGAFAQEHDPDSADHYAGVASAIVRELREEQHVDAVVAVNHLGSYRDRLLIDQVRGLDVVISAHDHIAIPGHVEGKNGFLVNGGSFLGDDDEARVGEVVIDVDTRWKSARLVSTSSRKIEDLREVDATVAGEVRRMLECFAPDAETPVADLVSPVPRRDPDTWTKILDAALRARFPGVAAIVYEAWGYAGIVKEDLPRGPVTAQALFDMTHPEKQRSGGPGFTAFVGVDVSGRALRDLCSTSLHEPAFHQVHRVCPLLDDLLPEGTYRVVFERRPLHAPKYAFEVPPYTLPKPTEVVTPSYEAFEVLLGYARERGKACLALDADVKATCR